MRSPLVHHCRTSLIWLIVALLHKVDARGLVVSGSNAADSAIEIASSGGFVNRGLGLGKRDGVTLGEKAWPAWPQAALDDSEKILLTLDGGTQPQKVLFQEGTFIRKAVQGVDSSSIMMEALVNDLYAAAGVNAPKCRYYPTTAKVTKAYMLCHWTEGLRNFNELDRTSLYHASANFVLDAIFANSGLWGRRGNLALDNAGKTMRIDNGGSLATDDHGEWKRTVYDCSAPLSDRRQTWSREPFSLWDMRSVGSDLHAYVTSRDIHGEAQSILRKKDAILKVVDNFNSTTATKRVKKTLQARLDCLSRIVKNNVDLLGIVAKTDDAPLPKEVCEGVRSLCHEFLVDYL